MYTRIVTFRLNGPTGDEYRQHAAAIADAFAAWDGLVAKLWIAEPGSETYGGIYVFASKDHADRSRQTPEFTGLVVNPGFTDLAINEYEVLDDLTARTGGVLTAA